MKSMSILISVFTPTYNRAHTIHRVWNSLNKQTLKDFEWIIVDDGSTDNIDKMINEFKEYSDFKIVYHKFKTNRGKHIAINKGLSLCSGKFFIIADSDDAFIPESLEFFISKWNEIPEIERANFSGIRACCNDQFGNRVSDYLIKEPLDASMSEAFYIHKFRKESWCMVLTEMHRKYLFPDNHEDHFYPEGIIWSKISREKKFRFFNKALRTYYIDISEPSISNQNLNQRKKIPRNLAMGSHLLNNELMFFAHDPLHFIKSTAIYCYYSIIDKSYVKQLNNLGRFKAKALFITLTPVGLLFPLLKKITKK
jgi:glycosyltransferase involved in cell wall biosynthesis